MAIVGAAEDARIDVLVVGNAGHGRTQGVPARQRPNRISHNARCTVIIVNTTDGVTSAMPAPSTGLGPSLWRAGRRDASRT